MAAFRYLGATMSSIDQEVEEVMASTIRFINPTIMEYNFHTSYYDVAKRYRQIKSVAETDTILIAKINSDVTLGKKALLSSIVKAKFTYNDLLALSVSNSPVIEDAIYMESGLNMTDTEKIIPEWYDIVNTRLILNLRKKMDLIDPATSTSPEANT